MIFLPLSIHRHSIHSLVVAFLVHFVLSLTHTQRVVRCAIRECSKSIVLTSIMWPVEMSMLQEAGSSHHEDVEERPEAPTVDPSLEEDADVFFLRD